MLFCYSLTNNNIQKIFDVYSEFKNVEGFSYVATSNEILQNNALLNISLYVKKYADLESDVGFC